MTKAEILNGLAHLQADERRQVFDRLCELEEQDLLCGIGPTNQEKQVLDEAFAEFERDGDPGTPWRNALQRLCYLHDA